MGCAFIMATILYIPTCMPSDGDGEPLIICVVAGSGASAGTVSKTLTR